MSKQLTPDQRKEIADYIEDRIENRLTVTPWYDARGWDAWPITMSVLGVIAAALGTAYVLPAIILEWQKVLP